MQTTTDKPIDVLNQIQQIGDNYEITIPVRIVESGSTRRMYHLNGKNEELIAIIDIDTIVNETADQEIVDQALTDEQLFIEDEEDEDYKNYYNLQKPVKMPHMPWESVKVICRYFIENTEEEDPDIYKVGNYQLTISSSSTEKIVALFGL